MTLREADGKETEVLVESGRMNLAQNAAGYDASAF
jgi:hypothetical protein